MTTYINFFGGPGSGKSTSSAMLFSQMKQQNQSVELVTEVAKDFVWEDRKETLQIQPYVSAKQYRNLVRLKGKVDFVVTDAPLLMGLVYAKYFDLPQSFFDCIVDLNNQFLQPSVNIFLERNTEYETRGRLQSEQDAIKIDNIVKNMLTDNNISYKIALPNETFLNLANFKTTPF